MARRTGVNPSTDQTYHRRLRKVVLDHFDGDELRVFSSDLGVDLDSLPGQAKERKVSELIAYLERRGALEKLVELGLVERPNAPWDETFTERQDTPGSYDMKERVFTERNANWLQIGRSCMVAGNQSLNDHKYGQAFQSFQRARLLGEQTGDVDIYRESSLGLAKLYSETQLYPEVDIRAQRVWQGNYLTHESVEALELSGRALEAQGKTLRAVVAGSLLQSC